MLLNNIMFVGSLCVADPLQNELESLAPNLEIRLCSGHDLECFGLVLHQIAVRNGKRPLMVPGIGQGLFVKVTVLEMEDVFDFDGRLPFFLFLFAGIPPQILMVRGHLELMVMRTAAVPEFEELSASAHCLDDIDNLSALLLQRHAVDEGGTVTGTVRHDVA